MRNLYNLLDRIQSCNQRVTGERRRGCQLPKQWSPDIPHMRALQWSAAGVEWHRWVTVTQSPDTGGALTLTSAEVTPDWRDRAEKWRQWYDRNMETRLTRGRSQDSGMLCLAFLVQQFYKHKTPDIMRVDFVISINLLVCTLRFVTRKSALHSHYSLETVCLATFSPQFRQMISRLYKIGVHYFGPFMPDINGEQFCCATCLQRLQSCNYSASKSAWISIQGLLYPQARGQAGPGLTEDWAGDALEYGRLLFSGVWISLVLNLCRFERPEPISVHTVLNACANCLQPLLAGQFHIRNAMLSAGLNQL